MLVSCSADFFGCNPAIFDDAFQNKPRAFVRDGLDAARSSFGTSGIEQILCWNAEGGGDFVYVDKAYISFATLNAADISTVKIAGERQRLL
jgi:hypothetical protein